MLVRTSKQQDNNDGEVFRDYFEVAKNVNELVENPMKIPELRARNEPSMTLSLTQSLNLPRLNIDKFDGNPRHYTSCIRIHVYLPNKRRILHCTNLVH